MSNIYYLEKLTFSKLQYYRNENLKKCTTFEGIFAEIFILALSSSAVFRLQNFVSDFF